MDCSVVVALVLSATAPVHAMPASPGCSAVMVRVADAPAPPASAAPPAATSKISHEPFYGGLVNDARQLRAETKSFNLKPSLTLLKSERFTVYAKAIRNLSAGDLKGHNDLKMRGTDNDLKCIMLGVSRDLINKINDIEAAKTDAALGQALTNMDLLLRDNIAVIVTPETVASGLDCVAEFGKDA
ncbi:hypothetical protein [Asticcacaulis sp. EMRT-3]|uniref:hypothetical protein n=1 Tax=Asticcacaulis sp. EMRT-3 TaxID=3040349 RepID=UPI0024AEFAB1|nr:hypothetical protein [Asticcacaulis sp. EMRT-3]MDI7775325.1 hypothetical protein [Asticcacaulis sp. EMRT-3]